MFSGDVHQLAARFQCDVDIIMAVAEHLYLPIGRRESVRLDPLQFHELQRLVAIVQSARAKTAREMENGLTSC